jgi:hypothetical protein
MYAADREPVGLVKVSDRLVVLTLSILDHEPVSSVIGVDRQGTPATIAAGVAPEPIKRCWRLAASPRIASHRSTT